MQDFLQSKLPQLLLVLIGASFFTFSLTYLSPGDPVETMFEAQGFMPTQEAIAEARKEMGLDAPFLIQYGRWVGNIVTGDLGTSYVTSGPVFEMMKRRIPMTVKLALTALLFLFVFSLLFGILSAFYRNRIPDFLIRALSFCNLSIPDFWLGLLLIYFFVVKLNLFRITDPYAPSSVILPSLTLAIPLIGRYTRQIRAALLEEISNDYVVGARARGIKEPTIMLRHVLPNAMSSLLTLFGLSTAALMGGTVIVETIFSWPGLGRMAMDAITQRDYPVLQAYVLLMALIYTGISFLVDLITQMMNPRSREKGRKKQ